MNLKIRIALLFTSFVTFILIASAILIYVLYYNFRLQEFYRRIITEAESVYISFADANDKHQNYQYFFNAYKNGLTSQQEIIIFDSTAKQLFVYPDTLKKSLGPQYFKIAKKNMECRFKENRREGVIIYNAKRNEYIFLSALDKYGLAKVKKIRLILLGVLSGGIFLTALSAFFIVKQAIKPLKKLSEDIEETTALTLDQKMVESKNTDEISQIAKSYNIMLQRLKRAFDSQKSFVQYASHELRTPLATMLLQTESALNKNLSNDEAKKILHSLKEEQEGMIELTNSLLLLSQYDAIDSYENFLAIRIDEILFECINDAKRNLAEINIALQVNEIDNPNWLLIKGNESLLRSAFSNLIKNAFLYSNNKAVNIFLKATDANIEISFENTGDLVLPNEQEKLFIPFFRAENSIHKNGHGLGLAIVHQIVQMHKGQIEYEVLNNNFNRFVITFKVA